PMSSLEVDDPDVVKVDFHSHTSGSWDARSGFSVEDNRAWHRASGYDVAYVTDHHASDAADAAQMGNPDVAGNGTVLLRGLELTLWKKTIVLGVDPEAHWNEAKERALKRPGAGASQVFSRSLLILSIPAKIPTRNRAGVFPKMPYAAIE